MAGLIAAGSVRINPTLAKVTHMDIQEIIREQVSNNPVVLYMKGTPQFPQCGFSATAAEILKRCGVKFVAVNMLESRELVEGMVKFANWPTIPLLFVRGEFIGGCDIMKEMYMAGELQSLLEGAPTV